MAKKTKSIAEFGDFQTPLGLAIRAMDIAVECFGSPTAIIEPSCGAGAFLEAAASRFPETPTIGIEISEHYLSLARARLCRHKNVQLAQGNFFNFDWEGLLAERKGPILVVGNPPWVTNAKLGTLGSSNLPMKVNSENLNGIDAITGKSNFDISEWMLLKNLGWLVEKTGGLVVLCKSSVARKVLAYSWKHRRPISDARLYRIDAAKHFGVAVDACLLVVSVGSGQSTICSVFDTLDSKKPDRRFGFVDAALVSDFDGHQRYKHLLGLGSRRWRSGLKHDCSKVMELEATAEGYKNGLGEIVSLEADYVFPLLKSSDVGGARDRAVPKYVLVPQTRVGEGTDQIRVRAPLTWAYLERHKNLLRARTSTVYRGKPDFSVFGIGDYSFAPWKVAVSGLYKALTFRIYGPIDGKPVFFDDTVYLLPFDKEDDARAVLAALNSEPAQTLISSMIFWDEKRPVTAGVLNRLDISQLIDVRLSAIAQPPSATLQPSFFDASAELEEVRLASRTRARAN